MNTIFVNTPDGIIKAEVIFNSLWNMYQLYIDGSLYGEFKNEIDALDGLDRSFSEKNIIKPEIILFLTNNLPLSTQVKRITGDNYDTDTFEHIYPLLLIKHKKTGLIIQVYNKEEIKRIYSI